MVRFPDKKGRLLIMNIFGWLGNPLSIQTEQCNCIHKPSTHHKLKTLFSLQESFFNLVTFFSRSRHSLVKHSREFYILQLNHSRFISRLTDKKNLAFWKTFIDCVPQTTIQLSNLRFVSLILFAFTPVSRLILLWKQWT